MYTYIKDQQLFVLNPSTGRIYKINMPGPYDPIIIHNNTLNFESEVIKHIKENNATLVRD